MRWGGGGGLWKCSEAQRAALKDSPACSSGQEEGLGSAYRNNSRLPFMQGPTKSIRVSKQVPTWKWPQESLRTTEGSENDQFSKANFWLPRHMGGGQKGLGVRER